MRTFTISVESLCVEGRLTDDTASHEHSQCVTIRLRSTRPLVDLDKNDV